jgi:hypothetical protein
MVDAGVFKGGGAIGLSCTLGFFLGGVGGVGGVSSVIYFASHSHRKAGSSRLSNVFYLKNARFGAKYHNMVTRYDKS